MGGGGYDVQPELMYTKVGKPSRPEAESLLNVSPNAQCAHHKVAGRIGAFIIFAYHYFQRKKNTPCNARP